MRTFFILFLCLLYSVLSYSNKLYVGEKKRFNSIMDAVKKASCGDSILVEKGTYFETGIIISKPVSLLGLDFPIVDGSNEPEEIFIINSDSVSISGFQIQNIKESYLKDLSGIRVVRKSHFLITNNRLYNTMFGIYLEYSNNGVVANNVLNGGAKFESNSGNGIHAWNCKNLIIKNNEVKFHRDGIYFEFVTESKIQKNVCENNLRYGLHFMFSNFDSYEYNIFRKNGAGVAVMFSKEIIMKHNKFYENWGGAAYGLLLKEIYDADITQNDFYKNTIGIRVEGSTRINYVSNDFRSNGWALKIAGGCYDNYISKNNFVSNSFDLALDKASNNNKLERNYWSDYSGYDIDKNGTGDIPHRPVKLFNYIASKTPESVILLRSLFIDLINFSEKVSPIFTPKYVIDEFPEMQKIENNL